MIFMQSSSPQEADELEVISERDEESNASLRVVKEDCLLIRVEDVSGHETMRV